MTPWQIYVAIILDLIFVALAGILGVLLDTQRLIKRKA